MARSVMLVIWFFLARSAWWVSEIA